MTAADLTVTMSGVAYRTAVDGSSVPADEAWPTPVVTRAGRGYRYTYTVTDRQARLIETHLRDVGEMLGGDGVDTGPGEAVACLRAAEAIARQLDARTCRHDRTRADVAHTLGGHRRCIDCGATMP